MIGAFKVTAAGPDRRVIAKEVFEARSDAEQCFNELTGDTGNIIDSLGIAYMTVSMEELFAGDWVQTQVKTVVRS